MCAELSPGYSKFFHFSDIYFFKNAESAFFVWLVYVCIDQCLINKNLFSLWRSSLKVFIEFQKFDTVYDFEQLFSLKSRKRKYGTVIATNTLLLKENYLDIQKYNKNMSYADKGQSELSGYRLIQAILICCLSTKIICVLSGEHILGVIRRG